MKFTAVALFSLCFFASCDRESGRKMGRHVSESMPKEPLKGASEGIAGFIEGSMETAVENSRKSGDAYIEKLKKESAAQQAEYDRQRRYRDKGFSSNYKDYKSDGGFSSHGKDKGFPAFDK